MKVYDLLDNRKPEARTPVGSRGVGLVCFIETIPNVRSIFRRNSFPGVSDTERDFVTACRGRIQKYIAAGRGVTNRIVDQVLYYLTKTMPVRPNERFMLRTFVRDEMQGNRFLRREFNRVFVCTVQ